VEHRKILSPGQFDGRYLTADFVVERLATALARPPAERPRGDHDLNPGFSSPTKTPTQAAVLVPLIRRPEGLQVLLTQRTAHLKDHAGQISFPGGRAEPEDKDPTATALRETLEEVGLPPEFVRVLGRLDNYVTSTGYEVSPVVGLIQPPFPVTPDPNEVAEVFEVPLAFLVDPANHERHSREWQGRTRFYYVLPYQDRYIWGATAGMLVNLSNLLQPAGA
jgi:8-oxo-dGTP pyrophosphatase MutT (NUDIX family)